MVIQRRGVKWISLILSLMIIFTAMPLSALGETDAAALVSDLLAAQAEGETSPWVLAVLQSSPKNISLQDGVLSFTLRSYDPDMKALGSYSKAADHAAWRESLLSGLSAWNLDLSVAVGEDGTPEKKSLTSMMKTVRQAAKNARAAFGKKDMIQALTDLIWCSPTDEKKVTASSLLEVTDEFAAFIKAHGDVFPCESAAEWAPAFYPLAKWDFDISRGPREISLTWQGASYEAMLSQAYDEALLSLAEVSVTERPTRENLPVLWRSALASASVGLSKDHRTDCQAVFDLDDLIAGKLPEGYVSSFAAYKPAEWLEKLTAACDVLPLTACESFPKDGVNTAASRGRTVTVRVDKGGRNTYVQFADADTGVIRGDAFISPGKNVNIKIPEGTYIVRFASGSAWYGPNLLFGPLGTYSASDPIIVAKEKWKIVAGVSTDTFVLHDATLEEFIGGEDKSVTIQASLAPTTPVLEYLEVNPVLPEINPFTGLAATDVVMTPIVMVLDNAEDAYPHWGVSQADILFQVPNAGSGATKLLALFAGSYPEQAGPVRSGRASMLPAARFFDAAFAFAGPPSGVSGARNVDLLALMLRWGLTGNHKVYNLLASYDFSERLNGQGVALSHSLSCHVNAIHENMVAKDVPFEIRSFLFTDDPREDGEAATNIRILHRGENASSGSNSASRSVFNYDKAAGAYTRTNSSGLYTDRDTGEIITFANVIVLRVAFGWENGHVYLKDHMTGSGSAEIFQNGRYVRGAWSRSSDGSRLVLTDADGSELRLQRGKSFIVITNDITDVIYAP